MRFHRLVIENLNSFYGTHTLDFDRDIGGSPVFLIVGPTGAGKSTLLDAISLALFGVTPRLDRRTGDATRDVSHIISIGTGFARAELDFSMREADGTRTNYKATWSIRRAHDDPDGTPQRPERSLYSVAQSGIKLLASDHRAKFYQPAFDQVLRGVAVDDFKRSVLLAQGEFASFLHASDSDKASILERLTNTEIYRRIGAEAAMVRRGIEQAWKLKRERLGESGEVLDIDVDSVREQVADLDMAVASQKEQLTAMREFLTWQSDQARLETSLSEAKAQLASTAERLKERQSQYDKLEVDRRLRPALEPIRKRAELTQLDVKLRAQLEDLAGRLKQTETDGSAMERRIKQSEEAMEVLKRNAAEISPQLDEAERLIAVGEQQKQAMEPAFAHLKELKARKEALEGRVVSLNARIRELSDERDKLKTVVSEDSALAFEALETLFREALEPAFLQYDARLLALESLQKQASAQEALQKQAQDAQSQSRKRRAPLQATQTRYLNRLLELAGDSPEAFRSQLAEQVAATLRRRDALAEAERHVAAIAEAERERTELHEVISEIRFDVESISSEEQTTKTLEAEQRRVMESLKANLAVSQQVALLSELRETLTMGEPCPLCGSPLHPFCESDELEDMDSVARSDLGKIQVDLDAATQRLRETNMRVQQLAAHFVSRTTSLRHEESRQVAVAGVLERAQKQFARCVEEAGFSPLDAFRLKDPDVLQMEGKAAANRHEELDAQLQEIDGVRRQVEVATRKLDEFDREQMSDSLTSALEETRRLEDLIRLAQSELEAAEQHLAQRRADFAGSLAVWGVVGEAANVDAARALLASARTGHAQMAKLQQRLESIAQTLTAIGAESTQLTEQIDTLTVDIVAAEGKCATLTDALNANHEAVASLLMGRDANVVRQELKDQHVAAEKEMSDARRAEVEHAKRQTEIKTMVDGVSKSLSENQVALEMWNTTLDEILDTLEVSEEEAVSKILSETDREALEREQAALNERLAMTGQQVERIAASSVQHAGDKPDGYHPVEAEAVTSAQEDIDAQVLKLGGLKKELERAETAGKRHQDLAAEVQSLEAELERWRVVSDLIGVSDGASFKLFAQTLNLRGLVDRANIRLVNLHPRYTLDIPEDATKPSLTFVVRDRYRSDRPRPLSTLSGGETFLVSLALALALSDYRRIDFPVETLLLDEGFGTLDQDALQLALNTLHRLHQDGSRQIGIISHVDSLRDMVDTRVVVEKSGQGRSVIRVERGAQQWAG